MVKIHVIGGKIVLHVAGNIARERAGIIRDICKIK